MKIETRFDNSEPETNEAVVNEELDEFIDISIRELEDLNLIDDPLILVSNPYITLCDMSSSKVLIFSYLL